MAVEQKDYYAVLGVSEESSIDEIKKVYRKLAKEYHPDRTAGNKQKEQQFKDISEAYHVLSDPKRRSEYDKMRKNPYRGFQQGENYNDIFGFGKGSGGFSFSFDDLSSMFSGFSEGRTGDSFFSGSNAVKNSDHFAEINIPFDLAVNGGETMIMTSAHKKIKVKIPAGIEEGTAIKLKNLGQAKYPGLPKGSLVLTVHIDPHPLFERKGNDIYTHVSINLAQAVLGTKTEVRTVYGKRVYLKIPAGTQNGKVFNLNGMGIKNKYSTGNFYVKISVEIPSNLTPAQESILKKFAKETGMQY